jgi:hypothetical protein
LQRALLTFGVALLVLATGIGLAVPGYGAATFVVGAGLVGVFGGVGALVHVARMHHLLSRHRWTVRPCRFRVVGGGNGQPTLVLWPPLPLPESPDDAAQPWAVATAAAPTDAVLSVVSVNWRWGSLDECDRGLVWFVGDNAWGGVVAVPRTMDLFWVRPVRIPFLRAFLARRVLKQA